MSEKKLGKLRNLGTIFVTDIEPHIEALDKVCAHKKYVKANIPLPKTLIIDMESINFETTLIGLYFFVHSLPLFSKCCNIRSSG